MNLWRIPKPPQVPPAPPPLIYLLPCVDFEYWAQRHPLIHQHLSVENLGGRRLRLYHFMHFLLHQWQTNAPPIIFRERYPMIWCRNPVYDPSTIFSIPAENTQESELNSSTTYNTTL